MMSKWRRISTFGWTNQPKHDNCNRD